MITFRELIAEGNIIEGKKNTKQRYIILFNDIFICATSEGDSFLFEWKLDLCNSSFEFLKGLMIVIDIDLQMLIDKTDNDGVD